MQKTEDRALAGSPRAWMAHHTTFSRSIERACQVLDLVSRGGAGGNISVPNRVCSERVRNLDMYRNL